jgi:DNA-binding MarR family transcriptional regulator
MQEYSFPQAIPSRILEMPDSIWERGPATRLPWLSCRETPVSVLKNEIAQQQPFSSQEEEALLNTLRTADCLQRALQRKIRTWGVTSTQYNVLRILRGSQPEGLTCSAIGDRMITAVPDITRLLARLRGLQLIRQQRDKRDRRVLWTQISPAGLALLAETDDVVQHFPEQLLGHMDKDQLSNFIQLLEMARRNCGDTQAPVSCDGSGASCTTPAVTPDMAGNHGPQS